MRLALDARGLRAGVDGIGRFSLGVVGGLARQRPDWELQVVVPPESLPHLDGLDVSGVPLDAPRFRPGEGPKVCRLLGTLGSDAYLNLSMAGPRPAVPSIVTVHDLMVLRLRGYFGPSPLRNLLARAWFGLAIRRSASACSAIAVPSEHTAAMVESVLGMGHKTLVVGEGQDLFGPGDAALDGRGDFLLYVGNARAYKNLPRLISALELLAASGRRLPPVIMVVRRDRAFGAFAERLRGSPVEDIVRVESGVDEERLRELYLTCRAVVVPSLCEGFGLPALEGMAAGAPVLASRGTALEEVTGDAALLADPRSVESIAEGIRSLVSDDGLAERLSRAGAERAGAFSWDRTAARLAEKLEELTG
jgi:glycosyltransferase involved in cell wall biosynthesis